MVITILGGGIAGLATALALHRAGIRCTIYEAAPSLRPVGAGLALAANAMKAIRHLGIADEVIARGRIVSDFSIRDRKGNLIVRTESSPAMKKHGLVNVAIHRAELHDILLKNLPAGMVITGKRAVATVAEGKKTAVHFDDGTTVTSDCLIVADGINSAVRQNLVPASMPRYAGYTCWRAVISNNGPDIAETSETWGINGRFGIVPLANNKIYWFACINAPENDGEKKAFTIEDLRRHFKDFHAPVPALLDATENSGLIHNDIFDIEPIAHYAYGSIVLIGDAAHAATPDMGQGACLAVEDAVVLADELRNKISVADALRKFEQRRIAKTHYIMRASRRLGALKQTESSLLAGIRNLLIRMTPRSIREGQLKKVYRTDF